MVVGFVVSDKSSTVEEASYSEPGRLCVRTDRVLSEASPTNPRLRSYAGRLYLHLEV